MKLCTDCKFLGYEHECFRPIPGSEASPVTGKHPHILKCAYKERSSNRSLFGRERCGPDARFFQPDALARHKYAT